MFSLATFTSAFGCPFGSVTGNPCSSADLLNANSCAPLKAPPPSPGTEPSSGNSS